MRRAEEDRQWDILTRLRMDRPSKPYRLGDSVALELSLPCIVIGGRNGAGKSRLLRSLAAHVGENGVLLDVHRLCEQALAVLRSRDDFAEMTEEFSSIGPREDRRKDIERIVGRDYDSVEWFALEMDLTDEEVADRFRWTGEQSLVPYFHVSYSGLEYSSRDMGLGEFSVHFLFWILEHFREERGLVLLLDEPDAYLPPIGVSSFLSRLLRLCVERDWSLIMATHSEELIAQAVERRVFTLVRAGPSGEIAALHAADDPDVAEHLLARSPIEIILFCEDESACYLTRALLEATDPALSRSTTIIWGNGEGYIRKLQAHIPRIANGAVRFGYVFDGDQRDKIGVPKESEWVAVCLPTNDDPDTLFKRLASSPDELAQRLGVQSGDLVRSLDSAEGSDAHDWVNDLGGVYGRELVLRTFATLWCELNMEAVAEFQVDMNQLKSR